MTLRRAGPRTARQIAIQEAVSQFRFGPWARVRPPDDALQLGRRVSGARSLTRERHRPTAGRCEQPPVRCRHLHQAVSDCLLSLTQAGNPRATEQEDREAQATHPQHGGVRVVSSAASWPCGENRRLSLGCRRWRNVRHGVRGGGHRPGLLSAPNSGIALSAPRRGLPLFLPRDSPSEGRKVGRP